MRRQFIAAVVVILVFPGTVTARPGAAATSVLNGPTPDAAGTTTEVVEGASESLEQDLALVAAAHGWTIEQARAKHESAERVGAVADKIAAARAEIFVGSVLADYPDAPPILLI